MTDKLQSIRERWEAEEIDTDTLESAPDDIAYLLRLVDEADAEVAKWENIYGKWPGGPKIVENDVFAREDCIFTFCPSPPLCREKCQNPHSSPMR